MNHKVGNIKDADVQEHGGWLCGFFMPDGDVAQSKSLEVKYSVMNPGDTIPQHYHPKGEDLFIVIKGKLNVILDGKSYSLGEGDYVFQKAGSRETFTAVLEPTVIIAVRTPSRADNKVVEA